MILKFYGSLVALHLVGLVVHVGLAVHLAGLVGLAVHLVGRAGHRVNLVGLVDLAAHVILVDVHHVLQVVDLVHQCAGLLVDFIHAVHLQIVVVHVVFPVGLVDLVLQLVVDLAIPVAPAQLTVVALVDHVKNVFIYTLEYKNSIRLQKIEK